MTLRRGLGATYRLQLGPRFTFADAAAVVPYLSRLGVDTVYLSPIAEAVPGSPHGYDGTDPTRIRVELGGEPAYDALVAACEAHDLGICVDHVPNHLSTHTRGPWWRRLLAEGRHSPIAAVFDVDWDAGDGKVVLPLLGDPLDVAISDGTVRLGTLGREPVVLVGDADLPVAAGRAAPDLRTTLDAQHYRLADWHDPAGRNYRRFFDIDGLVGVRVEDPAVFSRTHALVAALARSGRLSALRVDHVDGLRQPAEYLARLADETGVPILVEKILTGDEQLRADWPVAGTTGYETIDALGGVLVDPHGLEHLAGYGGAEGDAQVGTLTVETRRLVADTSFFAQVRGAASRLGTSPTALRDVVTRLDRYRTYLGAAAGGTPAGSGDGGSPLRRELEETAVWRSLRTTDAPDGDGEVVDALLEPGHRDVMLGIQQLTAALMAKGVEDTAWYRLAGPLAFCEVGGDPARRRHDARERWHDLATRRAASRACGLVPGTTHDTKRAQDVRCRLYALTEMAAAFEGGLRALRTAMSLDADGGDLAFETRVAAQLALAVLPSLCGSPGRSAGDACSPFPAVAARLGEALVKGAREAKSRSSWAAPETAYEARLRELSGTLLSDDGALLRRSFGTVVDEVLRLGALNSLSSVVLRHAMPGLPDCYQGDEVWNLSLVDPDNRRRVDFTRLTRCLDGLEGVDAAELRRTWRDGRVKLLVTAACLQARRGPGGAALAPHAQCVRLAAWGPAAGSVHALARRAAAARGPDSWAVAVVTRLGGRLSVPGDDLPAGGSYEGTTIALPEDAPRSLTDAISGRSVVARDGTIDVVDALASLPVSLLVAGPGR